LCRQSAIVGGRVGLRQRPDPEGVGKSEVGSGSGDVQSPLTLSKHAIPLADFQFGSSNVCEPCTTFPALQCSSVGTISNEPLAYRYYGTHKPGGSNAIRRSRLQLVRHPNSK
jgi:hypothetical protein